MVWRAGGGAPMRRCISSTGNLHSYSYPSTDGSTSGASGGGGGGGGGHSPIPIWRAGTPPVMGMAGLSTSPGSLHAFHSVMTPPMNSPRGGQLLPMAPFERTWGDDVVRVVCISDTHSRHDALLRPGLLPPGDVLVHAGDFSTTGTRPQVENFRDFLKTVPYAHKVIVGGNHDITLHETYYELAGEERFHKSRPDGPYFPAEMRRMLMNLEGEWGVRYLENEAVEVMGLTFWGTPWTPEYGGWAFNYEPEGEYCRELYAAVPKDVDVLITHGPPAGVGDLTVKGIRAGCQVLLNEVRSRIRPRTHVFGHIHEGYGAYEDEQGWTKYLNASTSTLQYRPINPPIVLDVPLDRSLPARWVSVGDEEVTRLDLKDGVGRALPIRRRESATSLLSSNTSTASSSSPSASASASATAAAALATAALFGKDKCSSSSNSSSTTSTSATSATTGSSSNSSNINGGALAMVPPPSSSSSLSRSPTKPQPQRPMLSQRTQSFPFLAMSNLTARLAASAGASRASGASGGGPSLPIVVPGASSEEGGQGVGGGGNEGGQGRDRGDRESIGDSSSCSGSVVTTGTGGVSSSALTGNGNFTPSSSLDCLDVEVAERFMSLRMQQQQQLLQGGGGGGGDGGGSSDGGSSEALVELLQGEMHAHLHIVHQRSGATTPTPTSAGAPAPAPAPATATAGAEGEGDEGQQGSLEEEAPAPAPLASTPPLTRFAVGRRLR